MQQELFTLVQKLYNKLLKNTVIPNGGRPTKTKEKRQVTAD